MLKILAKAYGKAADFRNLLYDRGFLRSRELDVPVISVGNITVGGTGKTPLVIYAAKFLARAGERVCIVSRGYRRIDEDSLVVVSDGSNVLAEVDEAGDEPLVMAKALLGISAVVCDSERYRGGRHAVEELKASVVLLDDGFQHRRLKRDLDIVAVDATDPFGGFLPLPSGRLREPVENLGRAGMIVITKSDLMSDLSELRKQLLKYNSEAKLVLCRSETARVLSIRAYLENEPISDAGERSSLRYFPFCGIGNPESLFVQLRGEGLDIAGTRAFPDHHRYSADDARSVAAEAKVAGADALLTTSKDAVKFPWREADLPCYVVESRLVLDPENEFRSALDRCLADFRR